MLYNLQQLITYLLLILILPCSGAWAKKKESNYWSLGNFNHSLPDQFLEDATPKWMLEQIGEDFAYFKHKDISLRKINDCFDRHAQDWLLVKFSIYNNRVFVEKGFPDSFVDTRWKVYRRVFETLCQRVRVPNCVFLIACGDILVSAEDFPIFGWAKQKSDDRIILIPDFEVFLKAETLIEEVKAGIADFPWEEKKNQAVWRGSTTGGVMVTLENFSNLSRSRAVACSLDYPQWVDARYTQLVQCLEPENVRTEFASFFGPSMTIQEQLKYKYQLLIDGNSCAYSRAYWQLFSNSLTFKHDSPDIQWYYRGLQPYQHYIPLQHDLSDLIEKLEWANAHDDEAKAIMERARHFAWNNLQLEHIYHYLYLVLFEYGRLKMNT